jgi:hypothetical protein
MHFQTSGHLPALRDLISLRDKMHPGLVVVLTNAPLHPDTRSGKNIS